MNKLSFFVSSTCFDLGQIRKNIRDYFDNMGIQVYISEDGNFPVIPGYDNLENCYNNAEKSDAIILIVGKRYGSLADNGLSITHNEVLRAIKNDVPIYSFIDKEVMTLNRVRSQNAGSVLLGVDNDKLFEFINMVSSRKNIWTYGFEDSSDIISVLKSQISVLFKDALDKRKNFVKNSVEKYYGLVDVKSLKIIMEKGAHWEYRLLSQCLCDEVDKRKFKKLDYRLAVHFQPEVVSGPDCPDWFSRRISIIQAFVNPLSRLVKYIDEAVGPPGQAGDVEKIIYVSGALGKIYEAALDWAIATKYAAVDEEFVEAKDGLSLFANSIIDTFELFVSDLSREINNALNSNGEKSSINVCWKIEIDDRLVDESIALLGAATERYLKNR